MKLTALFVLTACLQVSARGFSQNITYSGNNVPLTTVLTVIKQQTGFYVVYNPDLVDKAKTVSISVANCPLKSFLQQALKDQPFDFTIENTTIFLSLKQGSSFSRRESAVTEARFLLIRGQVVSEKNAPLERANVTNKNSNASVVTDANGIFSVYASEGDILNFSYVGYQIVEVKIKSASSAIVVTSDGQLSSGTDDDTTNNTGRSALRRGQSLASGTKGFIIPLTPVTVSLGDVTVTLNTGYQKIRRDQLTGAASGISEKNYHQRVAVTGNFLESLEGKIPGLVYNGQTGDLTIRGVSTFDAVKQPLIVLDGFPTEIDLKTINPDDIISVSVLRDAAAASIYGVRASNGVITVETRRGKSGKPVFNLNSTLAVQDKPDFSYLKYIHADEFVQLQREQFYVQKPASFIYDLGFFKMNPAQEILFKGPQPGVTNPELSQAQVDQQLAALGSYDELNDYQRLFYQRRQTKNINFDVSGGSSSNTYYIGMNYIGETPVNRGSHNKQFNLNLANTFVFSKRFNFDFKGSYTNATNNRVSIPDYGDFFPYERLVDDKGNALPVSLGPGRDVIMTAITTANNETNKAAGLYDMLYYPYRELTSNSATLKYSAVRFQGRLNAIITDWLSLELGGNYENQISFNDTLQTEDNFRARMLINSMALKDPSTGNAIFENMPKGNILKKNIQKLRSYILRGQLNFKHNFGGEHSFTGILGAEQKKIADDGYTTSFFGYDDQSLIVKPINMAALNTATIPAFNFRPGNGARFSSNDYFGETAKDRRFMSWYGQATYVYNYKYVATGSYRIDQSNLFGVDPKYRNKPMWSVGLNWRLGEEDFIRQLPWIDQLQLRVATGFNGNVPTSYNGAFLILTSGLNTTLNTPLAYNDVLSPKNRSLRWETTQNYNIGLDYGFIKNRISGSVDYYIKKTKDVFGQFDADPTSGFYQYNANTASIENRGWEFLVNSINVKTRKFAWRTQLTASFNNNKVLAVKNTEFANSQLITSATTPVQGLPLNALYSYNYGGLNSDGQPYVLDRAGHQKVLSLFSFGSGIVDVTKEDLIYSGTTTPKYVLGLNNQFSLGAFDLSFLLMYYGGHVMRVEQPSPNSIENTTFPLQGAGNFWRTPGDEKNTVIPGFSPVLSTEPGYYPAAAFYGYQYASRFVRKADYIRLRDVIITYRAKAKFLETAGFKNTQLRLQAQNAYRYTFSGNDIDPDAIDRVSGIRKLEIQPLYSLTFSTNF